MPKIGISKTTAIHVSLLSVFIFLFTMCKKTSTLIATLTKYNQLYCKDATATHHTNNKNCAMMSNAIRVSLPNNILKIFFIYPLAAFFRKVQIYQTVCDFPKTLLFYRRFFPKQSCFFCGFFVSSRLVFAVFFAVFPGFFSVLFYKLSV